MGAWAGQAQAATKYWDVNGNAVGIGGAGAWTPTNNFWNTNAIGTGGIPSGWNNAALDDAAFSGGGTVAIGTLPVVAHNLRFVYGSTVSGGILTLAGTAPTVTVDGGGSATVSSTVAGTAGLIKAGAGNLTLTGTNSLRGGISVDAGVLELSGTNSANGANNVVTVNNGANLRVGANAFAGDTAAARLVLNNGSTLTFLSGAFTHDLTLGGGTVSINTVGTTTFNGMAMLAADTTLEFEGLNLTVTGDLRDTGGRVLSTRYAGSPFGISTVAVTGSQSYSGGTVVTGQGTTAIFSGANTYSGDTFVEGGAMLVLNNARANSDYSNIVLGSASGSGILSLGTGNGAYSESLGVGGKHVRWGGDGGFHARSGTTDVTVSLNGGSALTWGSGYFIGNGRTLILGTDVSNVNARQLDFRNDIDLGAAQRSVRADYGTLGDHALISGRLSGTGGGLTVTGIDNIPGLLELNNNTNSYSGPTVLGNGPVNSGSLLLGSRLALPGGIDGTPGGGSNLRFNGGVLLLSNASNHFLRGLGAAGDQVQWLGSGGFAATGSNRAVNLGGANATVRWNSAGFVPDGQSLILGSGFANATVDFQNPIDLNGATRTIRIGNGTAAIDATLSQPIHGTGGLVLTGLPGHDGVVELTGISDFRGNVTLGDAVNAGTSVTARVSRIGMAGFNGNLGAGNTIVLSSHDGGLTYTGAGETTDRAWTLSGGSTWQYTLANNGTGSLNLSGDITKDATGSTNILHLDGSYRLINYGGTLTGNAASLALGTTPGYAPGDVLVQTSVPGQVNLIARLPGLGLNFWDGPPLAASLHNGAIEGGTGIWNNAASSWVDKVADVNSAWLPGMAIFSAARGNVSLGENIDTMAMQFISDGYVIEGGGHTLRLMGLQGGSAPSLIRVDPGMTATIAANMIGTAGMLKGDTGTLVLRGANSYSGSTLVTGGTLKAAAAHTLSAVSAHSVSQGATLDTAGFDQRIAGLTNAGTVSLQSAAPGATLTVTGPYVGNNGVLRLGAVLGVDGRSDRLVLDGPGATASGRTTVQVRNLGGLGGPTVGNGIEVVTALNGATTTAQTTRDAFVLAGSTAVGGVEPKPGGVLRAPHVDAGAYEYYLHAADADGAGENWYLRSARPPEFLIDVSPGQEPEAFGLAANLPTYRVEVPLFAALPHQLRQGSLAMLGNMHQRIGDEVQGERHAWARVISTDVDMRQGGTVRPVSDGRVSGLQAGTDLWAGAGWRAGVYGGQLEGDVNVRGDASGMFELPVGANDLRSQFVGVYGTYMNGSGFYADTVLQAGRHRYTVQPVNLRSTSGKGDSLLASIELGQSVGLGEGWSIEPQLQIIHQQMDLDDVDIPGANIHQSADSGWVIRAGARVKGDLATAWGRLQPYGRFNVFRSAGGTDVARFTGPGAFADIASLTGSISSEFAGGATLTVGKHVDFYGEAGTLWAYGGNDAKVRSSLRASAGVRVRW